MTFGLWLLEANRWHWQVALAFWNHSPNQATWPTRASKASESRPSANWASWIPPMLTWQSRLLLPQDVASRPLTNHLFSLSWHSASDRPDFDIAFLHCRPGRLVSVWRPQIASHPVGSLLPAAWIGAIWKDGLVPQTLARRTLCLTLGLGAASGPSAGSEGMAEPVSLSTSVDLAGGPSPGSEGFASGAASSSLSVSESDWEDPPWLGLGDMSRLAILAKLLARLERAALFFGSGFLFKAFKADMASFFSSSIVLSSDLRSTASFYKMSKWLSRLTGPTPSTEMRQSSALVAQWTHTWTSLFRVRCPSRLFSQANTWQMSGGAESSSSSFNSKSAAWIGFFLVE